MRLIGNRSDPRIADEAEVHLARPGDAEEARGELRSLSLDRGRERVEVLDAALLGQSQPDEAVLAAIEGHGGDPISEELGERGPARRDHVFDGCHALELAGHEIEDGVVAEPFAQVDHQQVGAPVVAIVELERPPIVDLDRLGGEIGEVGGHRVEADGMLDHLGDPLCHPQGTVGPPSEIDQVHQFVGDRPEVQLRSHLYIGRHVQHLALIRVGEECLRQQVV